MLYPFPAKLAPVYVSGSNGMNTCKQEDAGLITLLSLTHEDAANTI